MGDNRVNIRELAAEMLLAIDKKEEHSHILLKNVLDKYDYLPKTDKSFLKRVVEGTLEYRLQIDYILNQFSKTPVNKMKPLIRQILRMSVYQILYMDKVPDRAICDEAVKLTGKRGFKGLQGFTNGVLRNISRNKDNIVWPDETSNPSEYLSVKYSCPKLVVDELLEEYGASKTQSILQAYLEKRKLFVRIDEYKGMPKLDSILNEWEQNAIKYSVSDRLPYVYEIDGIDKPESLALFNEGLYTVQDLSSAMVCELADIKNSDLVLDMCAAPGGKSLHAAAKIMTFGKGDCQMGRIISRDVSEYKTDYIDANVARMGYTTLVTTQVFDATVFDDNLEEKVDVVICDVPCSGYGVIGKKPDIKYNVTAEGFETLGNLQRQIVDNAKRYVKSGGTLMYSTCTLRADENEKMVKYIESEDGWSVVSMEKYTPDEGSDGFFIAKCVKK